MPRTPIHLDAEARALTLRTPVLWLDAAGVRRLFDRPRALESQRRAFRALGDGSAQNAGKLSLHSAAGGDATLTYTARLGPESGAVTKFISFAPGNAARGMPTISAVVIALDPATGQVAAILDGTSITTRRTAAASAHAVQLLAASGADVATIIGTGVQAREHVLALASSVPLREIRIVGRTPGRASALAAELSARLDIRVVASDDAQTAVRGARIIVTCTTSRTPVLRADWLGDGSLVLSVGSFEPGRHEVGADVVSRADLIVVDELSTSLAHAGPIMSAVDSGLLEPGAIVELGRCTVDPTAGRSSDDQIVFLNSTGIGVQDAAAAWSIIDAARDASTGTLLHSLND